MKFIQNLTEKIKGGYRIDRFEAHALINEADLYDLLSGANRLREHFLGKEVSFCSVVNAKSGSCGEDCKFCAQSVRHKSAIERYPLKDKTSITSAVESAVGAGAIRFGFVTSGGCLNKSDFEKILEMLRVEREREDISLCASLGTLSKEEALKLKSAGLSRYHHNLETSRKFFPEMCSTHSYDERVATVTAVKEAGLEVCSGGIFGIGEGWEDRIDLAFTLRELEVDSVPLNFLIPVKGTPLENAELLDPTDILKIIALYRFVLADKEISVCGGREKNLRDMQSWIFNAGASGAMIGNYLTTGGRPPEDDRQMVKDLGLIFREHKSVCLGHADDLR